MAGQKSTQLLNEPIPIRSKVFADGKLSMSTSNKNMSGSFSFNRQGGQALETKSSFTKVAH